MSVIQFSFRFCYVVRTVFFSFFLTPTDLFHSFTPAYPQPCTRNPLPDKTSVPLPPTLSKPFVPMNFQFPKTEVGKQNRSFNAKWFREYPWLHYVVGKDALCASCVQENLNSARNKEFVFIRFGFSS